MKHFAATGSICGTTLLKNDKIIRTKADATPISN